MTMKSGVVAVRGTIIGKVPPEIWQALEEDLESEGLGVLGEEQHKIPIEYYEPVVTLRQKGANDPCSNLIAEEVGDDDESSTA